MAITASAQDAPGFREAKPVWAQGREIEKNLTLGFAAALPAPARGERAVVRLAASTVYRVYVNGAFRGAGPARGPHGWYRIDEWDITDQLNAADNTVAIEVAGYNSCSYALLSQPSFLQAEVSAGEQVLAATGSDTKGFSCGVCTERVQKVCRISFQRPFSEVYRLEPGWDHWRRSGKFTHDAVTLAVQEPKRLLRHGSPYPSFGTAPALRLVSRGGMAPRTGDFKENHGNTFDAYPLDTLETNPFVEAQHLATSTRTPVGKAIAADEPIALKQGEFAIVDFGVNRTGLLGATITCDKKGRVFFAFDEILTDDDVNFCRLGCTNLVAYDLAPGRYSVETMEPYVMRYLKIMAVEGDCSVLNPHLLEYVNSETHNVQFAASDQRLGRLFTAGVETFRQNAVDVFMDCPSRERGGWLCDSFFTARVAKDVNGHTGIEHDFVQNFLLPEQYPTVPKGMFPMCYPSDHPDKNFIPNWAMWFVLQLDEYAARSGDREMIDALKPKVLALLDYFKRFQNSDGLLEKLESWVFIEWSDANNFVQDVNYPSNMLYAATLDAAARLYGMPELADQAGAIRQTIREQAYDGHFFVDNAVRKDGKLEVTRNRTEVCQYFAFFFDVATPKTHPELWQILRDEFGPKRAEKKAYPEIRAANSFVGNMLRVEILSRNGRCQQIMDESADYLLYMADRTGTLWENVTPTASCNHGFASHIVHTLYRDILGLYEVDTVNKRVDLRFTDVALSSCKGVIPTVDGPVALEWTREGDTVQFALAVPPGYKTRVESLGSLKAEPRTP